MHVVREALEVVKENHFLKTPLFTEPQEPQESISKFETKTIRQRSFAVEQWILATKMLWFTQIRFETLECSLFRRTVDPTALQCRATHDTDYSVDDSEDKAANFYLFFIKIEFIKSKRSRVSLVIHQRCSSSFKFLKFTSFKRRPIESRLFHALVWDIVQELGPS